MKRIVIIGAGAAGITTAARLLNAARRNEIQVILIDPSRTHDYQPMWTLVGAGVFSKQKSRRMMSEVLPRGVDWIQRSVTKIDPDECEVHTDDMNIVHYDYLVVCPGIKVDWQGIPGLAGSVGKNGVCSNYGYDTVDTTFDALKNFRGGRAIFTFPKSAVKCAGAPQKIMYLADDYLRRRGLRDNSEIIYVAPGGSIFGVDHFRPPLEAVVERKGISTMFGHHVTALDADAREVEITHVETGDTKSVQFDLIHITPPQCSPELVAQSPLANEAGWAEVDKYTTQSPKYSNVFSLGDASSLPTSKTAAAVRKQAPVLVKNLMRDIRGRGSVAKYDGYSSCPLVTGYRSALIAEFDYEGRPTPTIPGMDPRKERFVNYLLKAYGVPFIYWNLMLKGLM